MATPIQQNYTAEQRIQRAFVWIMRNPLFVAYSGVMMMGKTEVIEEDKDDKMGMMTAYTDGVNVKFYRDFVQSLTDPQLRFVMLHETLHKMFRHLTTWQHLFKQNAMVANMACDFVINNLIQKAGSSEVQMPPGCLYDPKYDGWDAGMVYKDLMKNAKTITILSDGSGSINGQQGFDAHDHEAAGEMTEQAKRELQELLDQAIRQGAILAGKMGGTVDRSIGELMEVKVDYKAVLRDFLTSYCRGTDETSWRRPSRRFLQYDMYLPSTYTEKMGHLVIGVDTSGSIGGDILTNFLSNCARLLADVNPERVDLIYWDAQVASHETYTTETLDTMVSSTKPKGGGGTQPSCLSKYLKKHDIKPDCIVNFTDGCVGDDWGSDWPCEVLWGIYENPGAVPSNGKMVHIDNAAE